MMEAVAIAADLCKRFEGFSARPYLCPAGVWTIGYGATFYEDGRVVGPNDPPISEARADILLQWHLRTSFLPKVLALCPGLAEESPERLAAILDFTYNLGAGALKTSTLRRRINDGEWHDVPNQLLRWNKAGGRVLRGLTLRRQAEAALI